MKYVMGKASIFNGAGRLHVYDFSALLSGADGVRSSEGFPCAAAATEPTGCALPEGLSGPDGKRGNVVSECSPGGSEGAEAAHFRPRVGRRGAGTMTQDADAEVCPGMVEG